MLGFLHIGHIGMRSLVVVGACSGQVALPDIPIRLQASKADVALFLSSWVPYPNYLKFCASALVLDIDLLSGCLEQIKAFQASSGGTDIVGVGGLDKRITFRINPRHGHHEPQRNSRLTPSSQLCPPRIRHHESQPANSDYWSLPINFRSQPRFSLVAASLVRNSGTTSACSTVG